MWQSLKPGNFSSLACDMANEVKYFQVLNRWTIVPSCYCIFVCISGEKTALKCGSVYGRSSTELKQCEENSRVCKLSEKLASDWSSGLAECDSL